MDASPARRRRPRKPKNELSAWIVEQRQVAGWKSEELAARLDVSDSTVRGWEAGRSVSEPNIAAMERLFGVEAPTRETAGPERSAVESMDRLARAIEGQNALIATLLGMLATDRQMTPESRAALDELIASAMAPDRSPLPTDDPPRVPAR